MRYPAAAQLPTVSTTSAGRGPGAAQGPPFTILRSDLLLRMHCYPTFTLPPPMAPSRDVLSTYTTRYPAPGKTPR